MVNIIGFLKGGLSKGKGVTGEIPAGKIGGNIREP